MSARTANARVIEMVRLELTVREADGVLCDHTIRRCLLLTATVGS